MMRYVLPLLLSGLLLFAVSGCDSTAPTAEDNESPMETIAPEMAFSVDQEATVTPPLTPGFFKLCKLAPEDPEFVFNFEASVSGPGADSGILNPTASLTSMTCEVMYEAPREDIVGPDEVTATELVPDGWRLDQVKIFAVDVVDGQQIVSTTTEDGPTITAEVLGLERGVTAVYYNKPDVQVGGEGCTPGAWKNRLLSLDRWPVEPDTPVSDVWSAVPAELADATLLEALDFRGGDSFNEKVEILLRAATAAYLNSLTVNYDLTTEQIIDGGNAAIASGDEDEVIETAFILDNFNNQVCPITER